MEEDNYDNPPLVSWWSDSHNRPSQSHWLQSTLSELDRKTTTIVNCIEGDGDSFAKRAEMFYTRRYELIKLLQDLHESYRSLSEKFDLLRTQNTNLIYLRPQPPPPPPPPSSLLQASSFSESDNSQACCSLRSQCDPTSTDMETKPHFLVHESVKENGDFKISKEEYSSDNLWNNMRQHLSRLIEDNVMQQSELAKRNDEKREMIKNLRAQVKKLMEENRVLKSYIPSYKMEMKRSQSSSTSKSRPLDCIGKFSLRD